MSIPNKIKTFIEQRTKIVEIKDAVRKELGLASQINEEGASVV